METYTLEAWTEEAIKRFGEDSRNWTFICPACGTVQSVQDLLDAGVSKNDLEGYVAFSCIGRFTKYKGCDWTLGGFLLIHKAEILYPDNSVRPCFEFAEAVLVGEVSHG